MAKKTRKEKAAEQAGKQYEVVSSRPVTSNSLPTNHRKLHIIFLFVLAIVMYGNTLNNDFALDDSLAILGNRDVIVNWTVVI